MRVKLNTENNQQFHQPPEKLPESKWPMPTYIDESSRFHKTAESAVNVFSIHEILEIEPH